MVENLLWRLADEASIAYETLADSAELYDLARRGADFADLLAWVQENLSQKV
jgi:hypothetical protein